jgi:hypothetical protein
MAARFDVSLEGLKCILWTPSGATDYTALGRFYISAIPSAGTYNTIWVEMTDEGDYSDYARVRIDDTGAVVLDVVDSTPPSSASLSSAPITPGWHTWAYARNDSADTHLLYVDGVLAGSVFLNFGLGAGPGGTGVLFNAIYLGTDTIAGNWDPSYHADFRDFTYGFLSATQIAQEFASAVPINTSILWRDTPLISDGVDRGGRVTPPRADWTAIGAVDYIPASGVGSGTSPAGTIVTEIYSDQDMHCPGSWYSGYKQKRIEKWGVAERALSNPKTGEWSGSTFSFRQSDYDRRFRQYFASNVNRYWTEPLEVLMTTREQRANLEQAYTVFAGRIVNAQPVSDISWEITLSDGVSQGLLSDRIQVPWRVIGDGFLNLLTSIADGLDKTTPEPIIYGEHIRTAYTPASEQGMIYTPTLLGTETFDIGFGDQEWYCWLVAGHAVTDILDIYRVTPGADPSLPANITSVIAGEGTAWLVPFYAGWTAKFVTPYRDRRSSAYGDDRRYTLIYGLITDPDAIACADGTSTLAIAVQGIETLGDGSGTLITDRFLQYRHFMINYVAHQSQQSYMSGTWLTNPEYDLANGPVPVVDEASFTACAAIAVARLPTDGYLGAAIIGAKAGDRATIRKWIADWNRSCGAQFGVTHNGQFRICVLHPTQAIKDAAPLYDDRLKILVDSFGTNVEWDQHANRVPFVADRDYLNGDRWFTIDVAEATDAIIGYGRDIVGEVREYPFAPGITMAYHLARLDVLASKHPPRIITLQADIGPDGRGDSLGYLDLGDYIRYRHYASVSAGASTVRLAQVVKHQVLVQERRVLIEALDCDDLIDYDSYTAPGAGGGDSVETTGVTCNTATVIPTPGYFSQTVDTTANGTDATITTPLPSGVATHAAWWKYPGANVGLGAQIGYISTIGSNYDTVLTMWSVPAGNACSGALSIVEMSDNVGGSAQSNITLDGVNDSTFSIPLLLSPAFDYYFLVTGFGPNDFGQCAFTFWAIDL